LLGQDSYYIDQSAKFDRDGGSVNFDHPDSLEFSLMARHLAALKGGEDIQVPVYDFATHRRLPQAVHVKHQAVVLVDGILILNEPRLREFFDESVFIEVAENIRYQRRLHRDVHERGRTPEGVRDQFFKQVKVMHDRFVEPSKSYASILVRDNRHVSSQRAGGARQGEVLELVKKWAAVP
jgi:uridine kinase